MGGEFRRSSRRAARVWQIKRLLDWVSQGEPARNNIIEAPLWLQGMIARDSQATAERIEAGVASA
jgi:hypothetical protein